MTWLGCLGSGDICQEHGKTISDYMSHGEHVVLAAALYTNIAISAVEQVGEPMKWLLRHDAVLNPRAILVPCLP